MCIAIYKPKDLVLTLDVLKRCWDANPHGAGFAFSDDGRMHIRKGYFKFNDFLKAVEDHKRRSLIIHFRWATAGLKKAKKNCHPFRLSETEVLIHNGTIHHMPDHSDSDTRRFVYDYLKPVHNQNPDLIWTEEGQNLMSMCIGARPDKSPARMIIMHEDESVAIINEEHGEWSTDGVWFSNDGWRKNKAASKKAKSYYEPAELDLAFDEDKAFYDPDPAHWRHEIETKAKRIHSKGK